MIFLFIPQWFFASFGYQQAIDKTSPAAVNILSSSSGESLCLQSREIYLEGLCLEWV